MRGFGVILFFLAGCLNAIAQKECRVMDWKSEQTVYTHLRHIMREQYDERRVMLSAAMNSSAAIMAYRDSCKTRYRKLLGTLPSRTSLRVQQRGTIPQKGYSIEKIVYESVPGHHVTANVYVPQGKGPFPAVLLMCGHEDEAKATESYQSTAILFALHKFVVLVVDPISQAERHQLVDVNGEPATRGGTTEHTLINAAANLVGTGAVAFELWDNVRGLDYLESRADVDKHRLGCLGNSGGGTQTTYLIAYDDRIKVAAPCSYVASRERNFELSGAADGCQHLSGEGEALLEISDFLIMFAPKPVLILAGKYDFVDYTGTQIAYSEVAAAYQTLGHEKAKLFVVEDGHGISKPKREAAVRWFKRWLYEDTTEVKEPKLHLLSREELACTDSYSVMSAFVKEVSCFDRSNERIPAGTSVQEEVLQKTIVSMMKSNNSAALLPEPVGTLQKEIGQVEKVILRKEGEMPLPLLAVYPTSVVRGTVLWFHPRGKQNVLDSVKLMRSYLDKGLAVIAADITGTGELSDHALSNDPKYYNNEYRNAMLALHVGTSLPVMRARDIVRVVEFASGNSRTTNQPISVYATGVSTVPAIYAAIADERIRNLTVATTLNSFEDIMANPLKKDAYSFVVPGVMLSHDLPDLHRLLGARLTVLP